ncbi:MAG: hypothetical protein GC154_00490 [bacterium]|nr:hypothetical protein [bacterium]
MQNVDTAFGNETPLNSRADKSGGILQTLSMWELAALGMAFVLIVFVSIPNFFHALGELRGKECSRRLTLAANCLKYLAVKNNTQPGEQICQLFDLNQLLEQVQRGGSFLGGTGRMIVYYKIGVEPDCAGEGDHSVDLIMGPNGEVPVPKCSLADGPEGDYYRENGLHVADVSKVTGDIGLE